jgi:sulfide:quinone oxidoreductase
MPRVLIIGGGTGGTMLANKLGRNKSFDVTVLSASPDHMFQPALLYVAFAHGSANIVRKERSLLSRHVRFVQDKVTLVNLRDRVVESESGTRYEYDTIVLATGADTDVGQIPGLQEVNAQFGDYHSTVAQAQKVWASLDAFKGGRSRSDKPRRSACARRPRSRAFCSPTGSYAKRVCGRRPG